MPHNLTELLPSLEAFGLWSYWIIGLASALEAYFATGILIPGTLVVDAGGILVQQGALDFFDLAWFVAIGSIIGGELSYWTGVFARHGLRSHWTPESSRSYRRAEALFRRHGGLALVIGRFAGPIAGLVPFAAAVAGIERRRFLIWNIISGFPYALVHVAIGYFLGDVITRLGPMATRAALLMGAVVFTLVLLWWLVIRIERMLPFVLSVLSSILRAIGENPNVRAWAARHPRLAGFLVKRFNSSRVSGLTATLLGFTFSYILFIWLASVLDLLMADPIVQVDIRLANLIHAFWTPALLRIAAYVTALGDWRVVGALAAAVIMWLWLRRRNDLLLGLVVVVLGNIMTVILLKAAFHRPRPELAYFSETSGSFPSGHAAISVAFYATVLFIFWRMRLLGPIMAGLIAVTIALIIGLSRIYLIEHYLSDVLNGWLVGALWLVVAVAATEWWRETHSPRVASAPDRRLGLTVAVGALVLIAAAGWTVAHYDKARAIPEHSLTSETIASAAAPFITGSVPATTESVTGTPLEPINIIVLARNTTGLTQAMQSAGWNTADRPSIYILVRAGWLALTQGSYPNAPVTPYFWAGLPNDLTFERPARRRSLHNRHHVRFWETRFVMAGGLRVFVGAASFDDGLDWTLPHHIDPNIDAERGTLTRDLQTAGVLAADNQVRISTPRLGQSVAGDPWLTDGKVTILTIK